MKHNLRFYSLVLILTLLPIAIVATSQVMTYQPSAYYYNISPTPSFSNSKKILTGINLVAVAKNSKPAEWVGYNMYCETEVKLKLTIDDINLVEGFGIIRDSPIYADFMVLNPVSPRLTIPTRRATLTKTIIDSVTGRYNYQGEVLWPKNTPNLNKGTNWKAQANIRVNGGSKFRPMYESGGFSNIISFSIDNYRPNAPCRR